jgi:tetratricopeptide (TPR) repeat protein
VAIDSQTLFHEKLQAGKLAFDRGQYRLSIDDFKTALSLVNLSSKQGGEAQLWLVMAYQAAGDLDTARSLCRKLTHHPQAELRKQGKQVLSILEAPRLARPKEWMTEIPDLADMTASPPSYVQGTGKKRTAKTVSPIQFEDRSKMNTQDNGFIVLAIGIVLFLIGGAVWFS